MQYIINNTSGIQRNEVKALLSVIHCIRESEANKDELQIETTNCRDSVYLQVGLQILCDEYSFVSLGGETYQRVSAEKMRPSFLKAKLNNEKEGCLPVVSFPVDANDDNNKNEITSAIEDVIIEKANIPSNVALGLRYVVDEITDNIIEHANSELGYLSAKWTNDRLELCIGDRGKTIYGSYVDNGISGIEDDGIALQAAMQGVSTKNLPNAENRGYGLSTSRDLLINGLEGSFSVCSGQAIQIRNGDKDNYIFLPNELIFPGTITYCTMCFPRKNFSIYNHIS